KAQVHFTLGSDQLLAGRLEIQDGGMTYDNVLFFTLDRKEKIRVLAIGPGNPEFLERIYTPEEFRFEAQNIKTLNYGDLETQNLIVLNELKNIPNALITNLRSFTEKGGWLAVIPGAGTDLDSYNRLAAHYGLTAFEKEITKKRNITDIAFANPLYENVFEKKVTNFQYPNVLSYFGIRSNFPTILAYDNKAPFLLGGNGTYFFSAPLSRQNSNFKNSPLIVPTFYSMGNASLKLPSVYTPMQQGVHLDVPIALENDQILELAQGDYRFIPLQNPRKNKVTLTFDENPKRPGIYSIYKSGEAIGHLAFNHLREEGDLKYLNSDRGGVMDSIAALFASLEKESSINELWKWFLILAILFLLAELFIQKYFP
ncbi:MAG: hypothetical protein AAGA86_13560, partial [Bacteroidota bacterium]